jgi:mRNA interferase RelE/StbE
VLPYRTDIRTRAAEVIRALPPGVKRGVKEALRALALDPGLGDPLHGELKGRFKYRVRRYRIIYSIDRGARTLRILAVGHRRTVYEELAEKLKDDE